MPKAKRSRKKNVAKKRSPVVRRTPAKPKAAKPKAAKPKAAKPKAAKPKAPKGYQKRITPSGITKRVNPKIDSKLGKYLKEKIKAQRQAVEIKRLRAELRQVKKAHKTSIRINKKIERLGGFKGVKRILERQEAKEHRHQVRKHRKEIISKVREIMSYDEGAYEDYEDFERDEALEELREDYDLDLEDWLDICVEDGLTEHEAYELWYGYS